MYRIALHLAIVALLCACESAPPTKSSLPVATTSDRPKTARISGRAFHLERIATGPGTTLDVQLIDDRIADAQPEATTSATRARARFEVTGASPYAFEWPIELSLLDPAARYSVRATLRDARGRLLFATDARVPVTPGAPVEVRLRLTTVD